MILTEIETRVLGSLIEKDITTPDYYPLSLNALVNACSQKNNRDPVMTLNESAVREALSTLVPWWQYVLGGVYVLTILYLPTGLMGIPERIRQRRVRTGSREKGKEMAPVTP